MKMLTVKTKIPLMKVKLLVQKAKQVKAKDKESPMELSVNDETSVTSKVKKVKVPPFKIIPPDNLQMLLISI